MTEAERNLAAVIEILLEWQADAERALANKRRSFVDRLLEDEEQMPRGT